MEEVFSVQGYVQELLEKGVFSINYRIQGQELWWGGTFAVHVVKRFSNSFIVQNIECSQGRMIHQENGLFRLQLPLQEFTIYSKLAFYPANPDHADIFQGSEVGYGGGREDFPGSVAVLSSEFRPKLTRFHWLQYCFRQGSPPELTRSLASKYMGARHHLLNYALDLSFNAGVDKI